MSDKAAFRPVRTGSTVRLYLEPKPEDGAQPVRRLYWLSAERSEGAWATDLDAERVDGWLDLAVSTEFDPATDGDKRSWRLSTRYLPARFRPEPPALGIDAELLGAVTWERA